MRVTEGVINIYYRHVWKYHNEPPHFIQLIYVNKIIFSINIF
jgi:hypothetical protein